MRVVMGRTARGVYQHVGEDSAPTVTVFLNEEKVEALGDPAELGIVLIEPNPIVGEVQA